MSTLARPMTGRLSDWEPRFIPPKEPEEPLEEPVRNRIAEMQVLVRSLTYGEMLELAAGLWKVWPTEKELRKTEGPLPQTWHRWSTSQ